MGANRHRIIVTEIPYQVNKSVLVKKIADLVHEKKIEGISDIRDESNDRQGMRIVIELKKDVQPQVVLNMLYKHTPMQENFGANMLALVDGKPRVLNLREMIFYYLKHQKEVVTRRTRYELDKANARAHIVEGLLKALDHIDEIVAIIRASKDTATAKEALMLRFEFSEKQAQAILDMRLARLTGLEREKLQEEYLELEKTIARLTAILADEHLLMDVIKTEISEIRDKFGDERRSELTIAEDDIDIEDLIQEENMVVTLTHDGYVKRVASSVYRAQHRGGRGVSGMNVKDTDYTTQMFVVSTHQEIMFFTNTGRVYSLKCYQIPEAGRQARGTAIINLLQIAGGEKVSTMLPMPKETEQEHNLVMATRNGMIKKTALEEFRNLRKNGLIAIALREGDELIGVRLSNGNDEMLVSTRKGKCIRFNERHVRNVGRNSIGVRSMKIAEGDEVIDIAAVEPETTVLAITTLGYGKRTDPDEYREQGRGGMGIKAMQLTEKAGDLAALMFVHEDEDILLITDDGTIIRARAADVRLCGRSTQGVRIMRLAEGSTVVGVCRAEKEEEEPAETAGETELTETTETVEPTETTEPTEATEPTEPTEAGKTAENGETPAPAGNDNEVKEENP
jgi:DNA gyrase subunit A